MRHQRSFYGALIGDTLKLIYPPERDEAEMRQHGLPAGSQNIVAGRLL